MGVASAITAYVIWGFFPLYFALLPGVSPYEISAGRVVWSCVLVALLITLFKRWPILISTLRNRRVLLGCAIGGLVISTNWTVYAYAVATDQVVQGALGYYLNPLVTVLFAVVLLRERLSRWQLAALALAATAAVVLTIAGGQVPWIALVLGVSFATYGLTKKLGNATSLESLGLETAAMLVPALVLMLVLGRRGELTAFSAPGGTSALIVGLGALTVVPLLFFGYATPKVPLSLMGLLQYINPTIQFILGLVVFNEAVTTTGIIGFTLVWIALLILAIEGVRKGRGARSTTTPIDSPQHPSAPPVHQ